MTPNLKTKRAGETRLDQISFADRLITDEEVTSATVVEVGTADLTLVVTEAEEQAVTFTVAGGTAGQSYTVECEANTSEGQTLLRRKTFNVI